MPSALDRQDVSKQGVYRTYRKLIKGPGQGQRLKQPGSPSMINPFGVCTLEKIEGHVQEGERGPAGQQRSRICFAEKGSEVVRGAFLWAVLCAQIYPSSHLQVWRLNCWLFASRSMQLLKSFSEDIFIKASLPISFLLTLFVICA